MIKTKLTDKEKNASEKPLSIRSRSAGFRILKSSINIKENEYTLVVSMNFRRKACYTIWFGTIKNMIN